MILFTGGGRDSVRGPIDLSSWPTVDVWCLRIQYYRVGNWANCIDDRHHEHATVNEEI